MELIGFGSKGNFRGGGKTQLQGEIFNIFDLKGSSATGLEKIVNVLWLINMVKRSNCRLSQGAIRRHSSRNLYNIYRLTD